MVKNRVSRYSLGFDWSIAAGDNGAAGVYNCPIVLPVQSVVLLSSTLLVTTALGSTGACNVSLGWAGAATSVLAATAFAALNAGTGGFTALLNAHGAATSRIITLTLSDDGLDAGAFTVLLDFMVL